jgi:hypothetical protein
MPIPTAEMTLITSGQSDLAAVKTRLGNLITAADAMYDLKPGNAVARAACLEMKGGARELLGLVEQYHASISRALMIVYGADGEAVVNGGGGGRR